MSGTKDSSIAVDSDDDEMPSTQINDEDFDFKRPNNIHRVHHSPPASPPIPLSQDDLVVGAKARAAEMEFEPSQSDSQTSELDSDEEIGARVNKIPPKQKPAPSTSSLPSLSTHSRAAPSVSAALPKATPKAIISNTTPVAPNIVPVNIAYPTATASKTTIHTSIPKPTAHKVAPNTTFAVASSKPTNAGVSSAEQVMQPPKSKSSAKSFSTEINVLQNLKSLTKSIETQLKEYLAMKQAIIGDMELFVSGNDHVQIKALETEVSANIKQIIELNDEWVKAEGEFNRKKDNTKKRLREKVENLEQETAHVRRKLEILESL